MTLPSNNGGSGTSKKKQTAVAVLIVIIIFAVIVGYRAYSNNVEKLEAESDKKVEEALKDVTNTKDGEPIQGPFTIEIISCSKDGYGYMDIKGSITNNWDFTLATDIIITGNDRNGDIVDFVEHFEILKPGKTYIVRSVNDNPQITGCGIQVDDYDIYG